VIDYGVAPGGALAMFAIVATSGKQFKVSEGDRIIVDRVPKNVGETVRLESVLMLGGDTRPMVGTPYLPGAAVEATVVSHRSGDKIIVFKFEARKRHRRKMGHRQQLSKLRIGAIQAPSGSGASTETAAPARTARGEPAPAKRASSKPKKATGAAAKAVDEQRTSEE
jgi:large subunit ribosomal protein L21